MNRFLVTERPITSFLRNRVRFFRSEPLPANSSVKQRFIGGAFWILAGNLGWRLFSAIATISIARILGPKSFGEFGMVRSTVQMFSVYAAFRLGNTAVKYVSEYRNNDPTKAARILKLTLMISGLLCGFISLVLLICSRFLSNHVLKNEDMHIAIAIGAFMLFFTIYGNVQASAIAGFENFRAIAKSNLIKGVLTPLICIPLTFWMGIEGAILGLSIVAAIVMYLLRQYIQQEIGSAQLPRNITATQAWKESGVLWKFALPGFLSGVITSMMLWLGRIILTRQEVGYSELGIFTAADQWRTMILFMPAVLARVILPIISSTIKESEEKLRESIGVQVQANCMIALPLAILIIGFTEPLAGIFGRQFIGTENVIPVLMLSVFFAAINQSIRIIYDGVGKRWLNLSMWALWGIVFIIATLHYAPVMGALGFALAHLLGEMVLFAVQASYVDLVLVKGVLRKHWKLFIISVLLLGVVYGTRQSFSKITAGILHFFMFTVACIPILNKVKTNWRNAKGVWS